MMMMMMMMHRRWRQNSRRTLCARMFKVHASGQLCGRSTGSVAQANGKNAASAMCYAAFGKSACDVANQAFGEPTVGWGSGIAWFAQRSRKTLRLQMQTRADSRSHYSLIPLQGRRCENMRALCSVVCGRF
jgi:hypothetical protein